MIRESFIWSWRSLDKEAGRRSGRIWSPGGSPEEEAERRSGRRYGYEVRIRGTIKR